MVKDHEKMLLKQMAEGQLILKFIANTDKMGDAGRGYRGLSNRLELLKTYSTNVNYRHLELSDCPAEETDHS